jgi:hypothetical protein
MGNVATPRGEIVVDERGRVRGLNRARRQRHTRYRVEEQNDGVITLTPVRTLSEAELRILMQRAELTRHPADLADELERAGDAVRAGDAATAAYLLDVPREDVERVTGTAS